MSGVYESLRDAENQGGVEGSTEGELTGEIHRPTTKKKRPMCCTAPFCAGSLSAALVTLVVCSLAFSGLAYAYIKVGQPAKPDDTPAAKGQIKEPITGKVFDTHATFNDADHTIIGVGVRQKVIGPLTINVYAVGFYVHTEKAQAALLPWKDVPQDQLKHDVKFYEQLNDHSISRNVRIVMTTNMVNKGKMQEGLNEALEPAIKNHIEGPDAQSQGEEKAHQFAKLFDTDPKENYQYDFACDPNSVLHPSIQKKAKPEMNEPLICVGLTDIYVGANAVSPTLKDDVANRLSILYDEGDNADVPDPVSNVAFKEKIRISPKGAETVELDLGGSATYYLFNVAGHGPKYFSIGAYSDWFKAQNALTEKYSDISPELLGGDKAFRDAFVSGPFGRAILIKFIAETKSSAFNEHHAAMEKSLKARSVTDDNIKAVMTMYKDTMGKAGVSKYAAGESVAYYCDAANGLTINVNTAENPLKETLTLPDPSGCSAVLDAFIGSHTYLPTTGCSMSWEGLFKEMVWDQTPVEVEIKFLTTTVKTSFPFTSRHANGAVTQIAGAVEQNVPLSLWERHLDEHAAIALYLNPDTVKALFGDMKSLKPEVLTTMDNKNKIISGALDRALHFAKVPGTAGGVATNSDMLRLTDIKKSLKNMYNDKTKEEAAVAALQPVLDWDVKADQRLLLQCDASNKLHAVWKIGGVVSKEAETAIPEVCKAVLETIVIGNSYLKGPLPTPDLFYGIWTAGK